MSERAEALARKFEAKAREATAVFQRLSDADWARTTAAEHARCTRAETLALHERDAAAAAAVVRGLADAELDRRGKLVAEMPEMSVADWADRLLCGHADQHLASIRDTVGA